MSPETASEIGEYAPGVGPLLELVQERVKEFSLQFTDTFYETLHQAQETSEILNKLSSDEFAHLKKRQAEHLTYLLSPELTLENHHAVASRSGEAHALIGVDVLWLIKSYNHFEARLQELIRPVTLTDEQREMLWHVVLRRIRNDLEGQVASYRRIETQVAKALAALDQHVLAAGNLADLIRGTMELVGKLPGNPCMFFARADRHGQLQVEASFGSYVDKYLQAMESGQIPKISIDPHLLAGQGPGGKAWRSGQIVRTDSWAQDLGLAPWRPVGMNLGFRSSVAIPLLDSSDRTAAMLSLYSRWPAYFASPRMRSFLSHVRHVLEHAILRFSNAQVIPIQEQQKFRGMLADGQLEMMFQPIIHLSDGSLSKFEALARLKNHDGKLFSPYSFLSAFGHAELLALFRQGLQQICTASEYLSSNGITAPFCINFPAEGLGDERYEHALFETLEKNGVSADRVQLEVLETELGGQHSELRQAFFKRLRKVGIRFAQDDLGSGHSSLLRMDEFDFDEVKIDQALVKATLDKPRRSLEFILHLTRLAHACNKQVTVEGLENQGLVEATAILGADFGQGYEIAHPMRLNEVASWYQNHVYQVDRDHTRTGLGQMAASLL
jgi:EAL domain-containing protein (putative c-di-GMP-specific phosphodiesterase class I)